MKRPSNGNDLFTPGASSRLADARSALLRARAGRDKALTRQRAGEAEVKRLETLSDETAKALKAARERSAGERPQAEAWSRVLAFAEADKNWSDREKSLGEEIAKLDGERKRLESERKQLSVRA